MPTQKHRIIINLMLILFVIIFLYLDLIIVKFLFTDNLLYIKVILLFIFIINILIIKEIFWLLKLLVPKPKYHYFKTEHFGKHEIILLDYFDENNISADPLFFESIIKYRKNQFNKMN